MRLRRFGKARSRGQSITVHVSRRTPQSLTSGVRRLLACPVNELIIEDMCTQPDGITSFPDFIFAAMARRGLGSVEVEESGTDSVRQPPTRWQFHSGGTGTVETIAETRPPHFRTYLARFARVCGISPYGSEVSVSIAAPFSGSLGTHHYSIVLRNSQQTGFGIRIHLHAIDNSSHPTGIA